MPSRQFLQLILSLFIGEIGTLFFFATVSQDSPVELDREEGGGEAPGGRQQGRRG